MEHGKKGSVNIMESDKFIKKCNEILLGIYFKQADRDSFMIKNKDIYVVWSCKTLQNNKALLSTNVPDGMYYEFTYNGDKKEIYVDSYKKCKNIVVKMED